MTAISEQSAPGAITGMERVPAVQGSSDVGLPLFAVGNAPRGAVVALMRPFLADTASTADADPGAGNIRWNHSTQASATELYIDDVDTLAADIAAALATLQAGGFAYLQQAGIAGAGTYQKWQVSSITDAAGYTKLAVVLVASAGTFADNAQILFSVQQPQAEGSTTVGRHMVPIMAGSMTPKQSAGCAALAYFAGSAGQPDVAYLAFDPSTEEHAQFAFAMPPSWNEGTVSFVPRFMHPAAATNFGVCWKLRAVAVSNDDTLVASFGTAQSSVDTGGTTSDAYAGPESAAITIAGAPQPGDLVLFDLYRDPLDAGDTLAVDAWLIGVDLYITTATATD